MIKIIVTFLFFSVGFLNAQSILENVQAKPISKEILKENFILKIDFHINAEGTFFLFYLVDPNIKNWIDLQQPKKTSEISNYLQTNFMSNRKGLIQVKNDTLFLESYDQFSLTPISSDDISKYKLSYSNSGHYEHLDSLLFKSSNEMKVRIKPNEKFTILSYSTVVVEEARDEDVLQEVWIKNSINGIFHDFSVEGDTLKLFSGTKHYWNFAIAKTEDVARITENEDGYFLEFNNLGFPAKIPIEFEPITY